MHVPEDAEELFRRSMRGARERAKMTQIQMSALLAERGVEIDHSGVARIERGERSPRLNEAVAIADVLGSSLMRMMMEPDRAPRTKEQLDYEHRELAERLARIDEQLEEVELREGQAHREATLLRGDRAQILTRLHDLEFGPWSGKRVRNRPASR